MATFKVTFRVVLAGTTEVEADSEEEARVKVDESEIPPRDLGEASVEEIELTSVTEVPED
jgi:hypothetical protein